MDKKNGSILGDKDTLFALLTALVKRSGGEIRISEKDLELVTKEDIVRLYYSKSTKEIVISTYSLNMPNLSDLN